MKHLNRFLVASFLIMIVASVNAQDKANPWAFSVGANAVDFFPTGANGSTLENGDLFEEFYNAGDHWNIIPSLSYLNVSRHIGKGFVFGLGGTINRVDQFGGRETTNNLTYFAADGEFSYGFRNLIGLNWLDPYLVLGGGYTWLENEGTGSNRGWGTANGGLGIRFWLSEKININVRSQYKQDFDNDEDSSFNIEREHFQHIVAFGFVLGPKDSDGDGIPDNKDLCPDTAGTEEFKGCPNANGEAAPDKDGDGVPDSADECPDFPGVAALAGCPDADKDGVKDEDDRCPTKSGVRANKGCPYEDTDKDGVLDKDDDCPTVAGAITNNGCPVEEKNEATSTPTTSPQVSLDVINDLNVQFKSVLFDYGKSTIRNESYGTLDNVANIMKEYPNTTFLIEGHTDSKGRDSYNLSLSDERANSVKNHLIGRGIPSIRLRSQGFGETRPIASNDTEYGRQANRRVELSIISQ